MSKFHILFLAFLLSLHFCESAKRCYDYTLSCRNCLDIFDHKLYSTAYRECPDATYYCQVNFLLAALFYLYSIKPKFII